MKAFGNIIAFAAVLVLCWGPANAEEQYKKYSRPSDEKVLVELIVNPEEWVFSVFTDDHEDVYSFDISEVRQGEDYISCGEDVELSDAGLSFPGLVISADEIKRIDVEHGVSLSETIISFISGEKKESARYKRKKSDRITFFGEVIVERDDFVRGSVVSFFGDIDVYGEVNEDVVAVFGDVFVGEEAVVRGDVISVSGKVELADKASVYGEIKSSKGRSSTRRHRARRWKDYQSTVNFTGAAYYNRVDGALIMAGAEYEHADSIIPSFETIAGYAFGSDRWRYKLSLKQTVLRGQVPVHIGGRLFRLLKSDDDKIISEAENSLFALLVNEDWKDYYEAEGGYGFARVNVLGWNEFEVGYLSEKQRWMDSNRNLWSLFGRKDFRGNYSSVPYDTLRARKSVFDDKQITSLNLRYTIDTRDDEKHPRRGWYGFASYEYSPERWKGDFDFKRFEARLKRFQPLGRHISLDLTVAYGYAEGDYLPLSRLFYLGGLGTIHGYRHKELIGTEYGMVSGEYRFRIPDSELAPFVHYDGGKIMGSRMSGEDDWNSSIGFGVDFDRSIRMFISKRLDRDESDPIFYARFSAAIL
jgi:hypothetical protein